MGFIKRFHRWLFTSKYGVIYTSGEKIAWYITFLLMIIFVIPAIKGGFIKSDRTMMWCALSLLGGFYNLYIRIRVKNRRLEELVK